MAGNTLAYFFQLRELYLIIEAEILKSIDVLTTLLFFDRQIQRMECIGVKCSTRCVTRIHRGGVSRIFSLHARYCSS